MTGTLRRRMPCEIEWLVRNADDRWSVSPASPECGRSTNVLKPRDLRQAFWKGEKVDVGVSQTAPGARVGRSDGQRTRVPMFAYM
jgi:hypothetical protein